MRPPVTWAGQLVLSGAAQQGAGMAVACPLAMHLPPTVWLLKRTV